MFWKNKKEKPETKIGDLYFLGDSRNISKKTVFELTNKKLGPDNKKIIRFKNHLPTIKNFFEVFKKRMNVTDNLKAVNMIKSEWKRLENFGINIPPVDYVLKSKASPDKERINIDGKEYEILEEDQSKQEESELYIIADKIEGVDFMDLRRNKKNPNLLKILKTNKKDFESLIDNLTNYIEDGNKKEDLLIWSDLSIFQFMYGKVKNDVKEKIYLVDLEPFFIKDIRNKYYKILGLLGDIDYLERFSGLKFKKQRDRLKKLLDLYKDNENIRN